MRRALVTLAVLPVVLLAACGDDDDDEGGSTTTAAASGGDSADEAAAIADLAATQGVEPTAITVVSVEDVTWRDGSLGCPEEGGIYTEALTEGVRIVLELDGEEFEYHAGPGRPAFYCADPQEPIEE